MMETNTPEVEATVLCGPDGRRLLRPLPLHLHELALYCRQLDNERPRKPGPTNGSKGAKGSFGVKRAAGRSGATSTSVSTEAIAQWLMLCSQVDVVRTNTAQFEEAQHYCGPIAGKQASDAMHRGSLATRLTRFVFFCNALEEVYRYVEPTYDQLQEGGAFNGFDKKSAAVTTKAMAVIHELADAQSLPADFSQLVADFDKLTEKYEAGLSVRLDLFGFETSDARNGLDLVRCLRNHVAHGTFPILENPDYSRDVSDELQATVLELLDFAVRVGALYIQLLLSLTNDSPQPAAHRTFFTDDEIGTEYAPPSWSGYLLSLHCQQDFGLNETAYFRWYRAIQEERDVKAESLAHDEEA